MNEIKWDLNRNQNEIDAFCNKMISNFAIYKTSSIIEELDYCKTITIDDIKSNINSYEKITGIMIGDLQITENNSIYFIIFDKIIIIFDENYLQEFHQFFSCNQLNYFNSECQRKIEQIITQKLNIDKTKNEIEIKDQNRLIKNQIVKLIIKKSQIRTQNRHHLSKTIITNETIKYDQNDFIQINQLKTNIHLYFNTKDQFLYILKKFDITNDETENRYHHEISFYERINNNIPLISKYYGKCEHGNIKTIIIEYIEGETLLNFITNRKNQINYMDKIRIIIEIMLSIEFIHLNNIILRDLKWDNIMIDSDENAILIDFDSSTFENNEVMTGDIGSFIFASPEQSKFNMYTQKSDIFSLGLIIHFILTEKKFSNNFISLYEKFNQNNFLDLKEMTTFSEKNVKLYKSCLEFSPNLRPNISALINNFLFIKSSEKSKNIRDLFIKLIKIREYQFNLFIELTGNKDNELIDDIVYMLGIFNYFNKIDIQKAIDYFSISSDHNNADAQYHLGIIYYNIKKDTDKAIHYLTLSANQNHPESQLILGKIYHNKNDINQAIHYLKLSANHKNDEANIILGLIYSNELENKNTNKAIFHFSNAANQNNVIAQQQLGRLYISTDIDKAIHYLTLASNQNDPESQYLLGKIYLYKDINKSIYYLELASNNSNHSSSQCLLGNIYESRKDMKKAIHYYELASNQGNDLAQYYLSKYYFDNVYINRDMNKAIHYLTLSANNNNSNAQYLLGDFYSNGKYIPIDINKAIHYLTLSANQNNAKAQCDLGYIYYENIYVPMDIEKSINYLNLSSNQNNAEAQCLLGKIYFEDKYIRRDINKAINLFNLSSKQGNFQSRMYLACLYYDGSYVTKDIDKSIHYFKLCSDQENDPVSQYYLGRIYYYEKKDINKSIYYFTLSSNQNNNFAQCHLGFIYYKGEYVTRDINKAIHYLKLASNQNNSYAQLYLYNIYCELIPQDLEKAFHYLKLSANNNHRLAQGMLGFVYYIHHDIEQAIFYLKLSSEKLNDQSLFFLGDIYFNGKYHQKNINKAINYFKESSCFNNNCAKNNLGVIYKNGDGVKKNIFQSIEYFEEAIRQKKDSYALCNLSKIYFFGIDVERNILKALELLENTPDKDIYICFFLFFIYYCGDESTIDYKKAFYYKNVHIFLSNHIDETKRIVKSIFSEFDADDIYIQLLTQFIRSYDLIYSLNEDIFTAFLNFIQFDSFENKNSQENVDELKRKEIDKHFYDGFYNE